MACMQPLLLFTVHVSACTGGLKPVDETSYCLYFLLTQFSFTLILCQLEILGHHLDGIIL